MFIQLASLFAFLVPFLLFSTFFSDQIFYFFFSGHASPIFTFLLDISAFLFSAAIGVLTFVSLKGIQPILQKILDFLEEINARNRGKDTNP